MAKYYRFISQEEYDTLKNEGVVINKNNGKPLFFLSD